MRQILPTSNSGVYISKDIYDIFRATQSVFGIKHIMNQDVVHVVDSKKMYIPQFREKFLTEIA